MEHRIISASEARAHFGQIMREVVESGQPVIVARSGKPQVMIVPLEEDGQPGGDKWTELIQEIEQIHAQIKQRLGDRPLPPPEEVIREMREERSEQLLNNLRGR